MKQTDLEQLLALIVRLEHRTKETVTQEEYQATMRLAQAVNAPTFITEYFARKGI